MDAGTAVTAIVSIIAAKTCAALGLWLRRRLRREQDDSRYRLELDDRHADGRHVRMTVTLARVQRTDSAA
ncbi:hypothetical protein [Streptomyces sp. NPDC059991]|uniref:hypothetical protein n=1 Tax=unclassified Streptomyces TaxID=2593676 RepID=UPI00369BA8E1